MKNETTGDSLPFLWGVQYYRAPTPARENWEKDLSSLKKIGCNTVKYWVQWRWNERREGEYCWDDLDELMRLAEVRGLRVVLNLILDVMPVWADRDYPETRMRFRNGQIVPTQSILSRQIGGYPGPCYSNGVMRKKRERFTRAAIEHFKEFPALLMWDVWNEPENHSAFRECDRFPELCYCDDCINGFLGWLRKKYGEIGRLNSVWGRCYSGFDEVEVPHDTGTICDFIDWREYHLDKLTADAAWRLKAVRELDPARHPHLHTVPNTGWCFSTLTCVDDFALSEPCEIFGASLMNDPQMCAQALSSARGKYFYNAEWHVDYGGLSMHQRVLSRSRFLYELLPQLGWGVKGVLFWQYRPEVLGTEAPAWGLVRPDGTPRPVTEHAESFISTAAPWLSPLVKCRPPKPEVLIFRSRKNDLFQFCRFGNLNSFRTSLKNYSDLLYGLNAPFGITDTLLPDAKALILPQPYCLTQPEADELDRFLRSGGVVLSESSLGGYDVTAGRHSERVPGCGLAERWNFFESESTSSRHLPTDGPNASEKAASGDIRKAMEATGAQGGEFFPIVGTEGVSGNGAVDCSELSGGDSLAFFREMPCVSRKRIGSGTLFYAGTLLGYGASRGTDFLRALLWVVLTEAGIPVRNGPDGLHTDLLCDEAGTPRFLVAVNTGKVPVSLELPPGRWKELYGRTGPIEPENAFLLIREDSGRTKEK